MEYQEDYPKLKTIKKVNNEEIKNQEFVHDDLENFDVDEV